MPPASFVSTQPSQFSQVPPVLQTIRKHAGKAFARTHATDAHESGLQIKYLGIIKGSRGPGFLLARYGFIVVLRRVNGSVGVE